MTNYLITTFRTEVDELLDEATIQELPIAGRYRQIRAAVTAYSQDRPDTFVEDESGDGGKYYEMVGTTPLLAQWVEGFSRTKSIEYPAATITSDETPTYLDLDDYDDAYWIAVSGTQTRYLRFINAAPAATDTWRIAYTIPYKWTASTTVKSVSQVGHNLTAGDYIYDTAKLSDTVIENGIPVTNTDYTAAYVEAGNTNLASHIVATAPTADTFTAYVLQTTTPDGDFSAIVYKAACLICNAIAAKYSRIGDSIVTADSGAHTTKAIEFNNRSKTFCNLYAELMGLAVGSGNGDGEQRAAAGAFVELKPLPSWNGRQPLFHRRR